jgi:hypothetical protein
MKRPRYTKGVESNKKCSSSKDFTSHVKEAEDLPGIKQTGREISVFLSWL